MAKRKLGKVPLYPPPEVILASTMKVGAAADLANVLMVLANTGDPAVVEPIKRLIREGASDKLIDTLKELTDDIRLEVKPCVNRETGEFSWAVVLATELPSPSSEAAYALAILRLIHEYDIDCFHQCAECRTYFVGDPRSTWCSRKCGSRNRQRAYQERKRAMKSTTLEPSDPLEPSTMIE